MAHELGIELRATDQIADQGLCLAVSGPKGGGKTLLSGMMGDSPYIVARSGRKDVPVLGLDIEGGMLTLQHRHDVEYATITDWAQYERAIDRMIGLPDPFPWGGIFVDNATELAELNMQSILKKARKTVPEWAEFRLNTQEMTVQVRKLRDLARARGIVVVFNVWDFTQMDDAGNIRKVGLDMTPRLLGRFTGAVDMVAWLEVLDDEPPCTRVLHLAGNNRVTAKFRRPLEGPGKDIPFDLYWRNPEDPANNPLLSLIGTLLGGEPWPKDRHIAPPNVKAGMIRRAESK